jgi:hypothetical protein
VMAAGAVDIIVSALIIVPAFDEYTAQAGLRMRKPAFIGHFFMPSLDMVSFDMPSFFIVSLDMLSLAMVSFFIESFDMLSLDIVSFFMSSAKAAGPSGARARPAAIATDTRVLFFIRCPPREF